MALTPFWQHVLVGVVAAAFVAAFVWRPLARRRRARPSQLGDILRRLSEEREAQRLEAALGRDEPLASADHDLADLDDRR